MRRLPALALLAALAAPAPSAQSVRDSVRVTLSMYTTYNAYTIRDTPRVACGAGVHATWPNVLQDLLGSETRTYGYQDYTLVATEDMYVPRGYGQVPPDQLPEGVLGHNPQLGGASDGPARSANCGRHAASVQRWLSGAWGLLNARPFRVTEWYATFTVPDGTAIALFEWEPGDGLDVAFDASFESEQSREIDVTAPGNKRPVVSYAWDFGDGETGAGARPTHTYDEAGEYTVRLTVTDDDGDEASREATVTVEAAHLTVEVLSAPEEAVEGDTLEVVARVTNSGTEPVFAVEADRVFTFTARLPDELEVQGAQTSGPDLTPVEVPDGEDAVEERPRLDPGESFEVRRSYVVDAAASYRVYGLTEWRKETAFLDWTGLFRVEGETPEIDRVAVRQPCEEAAPPCATTTVQPPDPLTVTVDLSTADGEAETVPTGRQRRRGGLGQWITDHELTRLGDGVLCVSGCVNVTVTVTDADSNPVEGATVQLSADAVAGPSVVTPDQGGGLFCDAPAGTSTSCGRPLELMTDAEGEAHAFYYTPGVIGLASTTVTARASVPEVGEIDGEAELGLAPTAVQFGAQAALLSAEDIDALRYAGAIRAGLSLPASINDACKNVNKALFGAVPTAAFEPEFVRAKDYVADYVCGTLIDEVGEQFDLVSTAADALAILDLLKKWAEFGEVYWFFNAFELPSVGLATVGVASPAPPFVDVVSDFTKAINDAMAKVYAGAIGDGRDPGPLTLEIFEVSYVRPVSVGGSTVGDKVAALYVRIRAGSVEHTALVREGYRPGFWLTEAGISVTTLDGAVTPGEAELTLTPLGDPNGRLGGAVPFQAGHVLTLSPGTPTAERVQVTAVSGTTVELSAPVRFAHDAGAIATRVDSMGVGVPPPPVPDGYAAGQPGAPAAPELGWLAPAPASHYDVEVARDSLFTDGVASADDLPEPAFTPPPLDGGRYYWRVRAGNLAGDGPWSRPFAFVVGPPRGDDLAAAIPLAGPLPLGAAEWVIGATAEAGEAAPSCGAGDNSLWFRVTPPASGPLLVDTEASTFDTVLSVWDGAAHPLTEAACNDDAVDSVVATGLSSLTVEAEAGAPFYVRVAGAGGAEGLAVLYVGAPRGVAAEAGAPPTALGLGAPYPNPARRRATAPVALPEAAPVRVTVHDALGRVVAVAQDGPLAAGRHAVAIGTDALPAGVYAVRLEAGGHVHVRPLTVIR